MKHDAKYELIAIKGKAPVKAWVKGVMFDENSRAQLLRAAELPFIYKWIAAMPDAHVGRGATIGSVIPTKGAIIPAAVGVDLGCGMMAVQTSLSANDLPDNLYELRLNIESAVPHGRSKKARGNSDKGSWSEPPNTVHKRWSKELLPKFDIICDKHATIKQTNNVIHLGTLGTGNHFIEVCLDENDSVWVMLHSGSRGVGNRIGSYFIEKAREDMRNHQKNLPDKDLAYLKEGTQHFADYVEAVDWAQNYARINREVMMEFTLAALRRTKGIPEFTADKIAVNCHHNYVAWEHHYGEEIIVTRKGAVSAQAGQLGIIPGSMGARSYIVRGKGNPESFCSCSHGAGRVMSRSKAKDFFSVADHIAATKDVECRKDKSVIDETPGAYKPIDKVMAAQTDLVDIEHTLKQVVCVKG